MQKNIFAQDQYLPGNELTLVSSGEPFFARLIDLINNAQRQIHFQVYIFDEDKTGKEVAAALKKAQQRGVEIYLTVDSYGSKSLSPEFIADLKQTGVQFKFFSPLPKRFYVFRIGRRLHSKVIVADHAEALIGGINIADKYRGNEQELPWLDFAIGVKGPVCAEISRICERIYREKYFGKINNQGKLTRKLHTGTAQSRPSLNDWFRQKNQIRAGYRAAFQKSQQSITVVASYFLPSRSIRTALKYAARRGVQVSVLLPGKSDIYMAKRATTYLYRWLLRNNIAIYEWHDSILHGKLAVVDNKWVTIGSYNLNHLSEYSSIEMNVEVLDETFATHTQNILTDLLAQSTAVTADSYSHKRRTIDKFLDWMSYVFARWMMFFLFFLVKREHEFKEQE